MRHRYWLTLRPAMPGTVPTKNLEHIENYDRRVFDESAGREVWGYVEYSEPLTEDQMFDYDLVKGKEESDE
jgi:hypothetical protein